MISNSRMRPVGISTLPLGQKSSELYGHSDVRCAWVVFICEYDFQGVSGVLHVRAASIHFFSIHYNGMYILFVIMYINTDKSLKNSFPSKNALKCNKKQYMIRTAFNTNTSRCGISDYFPNNFRILNI